MYIRGLLQNEYGEVVNYKVSYFILTERLFNKQGFFIGLLTYKNVSVGINDCYFYLIQAVGEGA